MKSVDTLREEHEGVLTVLDNLERAGRAAQRGAALPREVFADIQEFFAVFVDRCHHGKEEAEIFPRLLGGPHAGLVDRLEQDHVKGRALARAYAQAVQDYQPGDAAGGGRVAAAAREYSAFLREHIALETSDLFPAMKSIEAEDGAMSEAFERIEEERIGPGTHERLHAMIAGLPARIRPFTTTRLGPA